MDSVQLSSRTSFEREFEFQDATGSRIGCIWHYSTEAVQLISCFRIYISEHIKQPEESNYTCFSKFVPESIHQRKCIKKSKKKGLQMHEICSWVCSFCPHCTINIRWLSTSSLESCAKSLKHSKWWNSYHKQKGWVTFTWEVPNAPLTDVDSLVSKLFPLSPMRCKAWKSIIQYPHIHKIVPS